MSDLPSKKGMSKRPFAIFAACASVIGIGSGILAVLLLGPEWLWLKILMCSVGAIGIFSLVVSGCFWCAEKARYINEFIQNIQQIKSALNKINENANGLSNARTTYQALADSTCKSLETMNAQLIYVESIVNQHSNFKYHTTDVTKHLKQFIDDHSDEITEIHIICFGRKGYGEIIEHILEKELKISVKVIFCDPIKNNAICMKDDDHEIRKQIKALLKAKSALFKVIVSGIPPSIRASIVYTKDKGAVWGTIQSYNFAWEDDQLTLVKPKKSLIVVGDETSGKRDFDGIISCIESEFKRLSQSAERKAILKDNEVVFENVES